MKPIFECPFHESCYRDKEVVWQNNVPYEIVIPVKCKAPFLMNRKTGATICRITIDENQIENWREAVNDIGRKRSKGEQ